MAATQTAATDATKVDLSRLKRELAARVDGEVRFDAGTLGAYSTDACAELLAATGPSPKGTR